MGQENDTTVSELLRGMAGSFGRAVIMAGLVILILGLSK